MIMTEEVYLQVLQIKEEVERECQEVDQEQLRLWESLRKLRERREFLNKVKDQVKKTIIYCPDEIRQRYPYLKKNQQHHHHILLKLPYSSSSSSPPLSSCRVKKTSSSSLSIKRKRRKKDG